VQLVVAAIMRWFRLRSAFNSVESELGSETDSELLKGWWTI
jgi:hypothetical protein